VTEYQQHLRMCVNSGRKLKVVVPRLTDEQLLVLEKPKSDECLQSAGAIIPVDTSSTEDIQQHSKLWIHACDVPGCTYVGKMPQYLFQHKKRVHPSILYTCLVCGKNIKKHINYKLHVAKHNTETPGVVKCLHHKCTKLFENGDELQKHTRVAHKEVKKLQCNECNKCFAIKSKLAKHIILHWDWRRFKCDIPGCSYSAKVSFHLQRHKDQMHTLDLSPCSYCGKMFKDRFKCKKHEEKHKTDTPGIFKCHHMDCKEFFSAPKDLMTHMEQHKYQKCDVPGCLFSSKVIGNLNAHRRRAHSIFAYNCQLCGKGFVRSSYLKLHMQIHERVEPVVFTCTKNKRKQTFTPRVDLVTHLADNKHIFLQNNESKLINAIEIECHLCGKMFKGNRFQLHILRHETGTPGIIKCLYKGCNNIFISATDLKQHAAKHWDVSLRPCVCDFPQCNYASKTYIVLFQHKCIVHSSNLYTCDVCGKQFKNLKYVSQHLKRFHQKQLSAENPKSIIQRPNTAQERQELVYKDEIEEVVFY
jgi:Zinc finger, C2H2 type